MKVTTGLRACKTFLEGQFEQRAGGGESAICEGWVGHISKIGIKNISLIRKLLLQHFYLESKITDFFCKKVLVNPADPCKKQHGFFSCYRLFSNLANVPCHTKNTLQTCTMTLIMSLVTPKIYYKLVRWSYFWRREYHRGTKTRAVT